MSIAVPDRSAATANHVELGGALDPLAQATPSEPAVDEPTSSEDGGRQDTADDDYERL